MNDPRMQDPLATTGLTSRHRFAKVDCVEKGIVTYSELGLGGVTGRKMKERTFIARFHGTSHPTELKRNFIFRIEKYYRGDSYVTSHFDACMKGHDTCWML